MLTGNIARLPSWAACAVAVALFAAPALAQFPLAIDTSRALDAGHDHNVAAIVSGANAGQVWAWGGNAAGKLGNGTTVNASIPVRVGKNVAGFSSIVAVAASQANSYAIQSNGTLWAWGDRSDQISPGSRLGTGGTAPHLCVFNNVSKACAKSPLKVPIPLTPGHPTPGIQKVVQVGAGWGHVVALREDGTVWTWGGQGNGVELGQNASVTLDTPSQVRGVGGVGFLGGIKQIAVGYFHTVALKSDGTLVAWGRNSHGELGNGTFTASGLPIAIPALSSVAAIRSKGTFNLARTTAGTLYSWGGNSYGQLGVGPATGPLNHANVPTQILTDVAAMEAGYTTAFAKLANNNLMAWGLDTQAEPQLGIPPGAANCGSSNNRACVRVPSPVSAYNGASSVVAGAAHTIVVRADQSLAIFGNNASGQLGNDTGGGGTFGTRFSQGQWDPDFNLTPLGVDGSGSSVGARSRVGGISLLALGAGIDFGARAVNAGAGGAQTVTYENLDTVAVSVGQIAAPADFATSGDTCSNQSVGAGGACTFAVSFAPSQAGDRTNTLPINTSSTNEVATIDLVVAGVGINVPGAPTGVGATAGSGQATVTFTAPVSDGGAAVSSFTAISSPGGVSASAGGSPIIVSGLTNGTAYTFTVTAANAAGSGSPSAPSNAVTPQAATALLTVSLFGPGAGSVSSNPAGISCGATCAAQFPFAAGVTLAAAPSGGSSFAGWGGACAGTGGCSVTMDVARSVSATFAATPTGSVPPATDFNGDGKSDLLWRNAATGQVFRMLMNGLAIAGQALVYTEPNTAWKIVADADFNGDGVTDLLWRNDVTGQVYLMNFAASGMPSSGAVIYSEPNPAWKIVKATDLDGDGKADLLWWNSSTGQVYAMLMNGGVIGTQGMVFTEPDTAWRIAAVGDFSGTGRQNQLIWRNVSTGQVYFMTVSVAGGVFTQSGQMIYNSQLAYKVVAAADFNGDGKADLLWRHDASGDVYLMLMNGPAIAFEGVIYKEANLAWKIVAAGDYNGDLRSDILWRNYTTGQVFMMLMNGSAIASQAMVYQEPNTSWKILGPHEYAQ